MSRLPVDVAELMTCSRVLDGRGRARKLALIEAGTRKEPLSAQELIALHEALLFIAAFPDDAQVHAAAERGLGRVRSFVGRIESESPREYRRLRGSGIDGTIMEHSYTLDMLRALVVRFDRDIELVWDDESLGEVFDELLPLLVSPMEYDGLLDSSRSTREWLALARGRQSEAAWLTAQCDRLIQDRCIDAPLLDRLFDQINLYVRWRLRGGGASRTKIRFPRRAAFYHAPRGGAVAAPPMPQDVIDAPLPKRRKLSARDRDALIHAAQATLAVRGRETDPVTYANPREALLFNLDRGIDVMLIGMLPQRRLPIEGFIGYVAAKNRVPIAYGGGWMVFDSCTIGVNLFETFRGGESSHVFAQVLRVYRHLFKVRAFQVDPYQFGQDNEEAIRSGAFWFYHRLGFRPVEPELRAIAEREAKRIAADRTYRTSRAALRRLATGRMRLWLGGTDRAAEEPIDPAILSAAVTRAIGKKFNGDTKKAQIAATRGVARLVGAANRSGWTAHERAAFESLAMLMALIPDLARWPQRDRLALSRLMRAKGGPREIAFLKAMNRHERLRDSLRAITKSG